MRIGTKRLRTVALAGLAALACFMFTLAQRRLSFPVRELRLRTVSLSGEQRAAHGMARLWLRRDLSGRISVQTRALWEIAYPNAVDASAIEIAVKLANSTSAITPSM